MSHSLLDHPAIPSLQQIDILSEYLFQLFKARISHPQDETAAAACVFPPPGISVDMAVDCELLATVLSEAYQTPSIVHPLTSIAFR